MLPYFYSVWSVSGVASEKHLDRLALWAIGNGEEEGMESRPTVSILGQYGNKEIGLLIMKHLRWKVIPYYIESMFMDESVEWGLS